MSVVWSIQYTAYCMVHNMAHVKMGFFMLFFVNRDCIFRNAYFIPSHVHGNANWNRACKPVFVLIHFTCHGTIGKVISSLINEITGQSHKKSCDDVIVEAHQTGYLVNWNKVSVFRMSRVRHMPKYVLQNVDISLFQSENKNCSFIRTCFKSVLNHDPAYTQLSFGQFSMCNDYLYLKPSLYVVGSTRQLHSF